MACTVNPSTSEAQASRFLNLEPTYNIVKPGLYSLNNNNRNSNKYFINQFDSFILFI